MAGFQPDLPRIARSRSFRSVVALGGSAGPDRVASISQPGTVLLEGHLCFASANRCGISICHTGIAHTDAAGNVAPFSATRLAFPSGVISISPLSP